MCLPNPPRFPQQAIGMTPLSQLTRRNYLIAAHDALATAFALLASFYLRFEGGEAFYARLPLLLRILPLFVVFSVVICYVFNLTTTKWRFISLPDALNIMRVASVLTVALIVLDYAFIFTASNGKAPVLFGLDDVEDVVGDYAGRVRPISRVVMAPSAFEPEAHPEAVLMRARRLGLFVSRLPSLESGDVPRLTNVAVEDLLLRPSEKIDYARLETLVKGKAVIVTGGGGSIGSEICDRVATFGAARLLVIEHSEPALYAVMEALTARAANAVIEGRIADIRDRDRIMNLMKEFKPDIVFHAAALKHVPILERDWSEGVKTNIFGSVNIADAALAAGAEAMVMISTDKAIEPVSMLGLTKRFAEMYCQALDHDLASESDRKPRMRLISVRFGNVLASNGSVVPKFKAQIEAGGPVTVTHPDMVRYFMTIREACDLVLTAATHALTPARPDVSVYVLNMGQPVKIVEMAERMIRLSGLEPGIDIEVVFTGMRPGERLNEILFASEEPPVEIGVAGIMAAKPNEPPMQTLRKWLAALEEAIARDDRSTIRAVLKDALPQVRSNAAPSFR